MSHRANRRSIVMVNQQQDGVVVIDDDGNMPTPQHQSYHGSHNTMNRSPSHDHHHYDLSHSATSANKWSRNGYGAPIPTKQSGKFSKEESDTIKRAIEEYCAAKQITVQRLCSECDHKAELKGAWMEIAKCLPHRSVQSIYRHGIRQCHPFKRGAWSEEETATLVDLVQRMGKKWATIQAKLNRSADSCRDKYREMSDEYTKGRWNERETELLKRYIREHLSADPTADMVELGRMVDDQGIQLPWSTISKRMGKRSRLSCFKKWQKMTGLISDNGGPDLFETKRMNGGDYGDEDDDSTSDGPNIGKRYKLSHHHDQDQHSVDDKTTEYDMYSAKMAAETVEAVELPDTETLGPSVREI